MGERSNFPKQCKPVKTPSSKTQQDIHTKSVFDELELSMEINQALNPHMDESQQVFQSKTVFDEQELDMEMNQALVPHNHKSQIRTKKYDMPSMQRFELSTKMRSSYSLESPS